ncbi:hypothetical protein BS47DRAFT_1324649 [Hydnum rufescens UP504]|uniref:N-acetyl-D-glucosamine kinase n=1 Tax=Hydnum rufescens UP504 TaxID=1448309 RepID=A0A9P6B8C2_9AGAM|nr:hypothetical protein BS47DRAFT_1324649 [Hydnum rufescens UP504]
MSLYICIDCGGTKAAAVVANAKGDILGRGQGGPSNFKDVDLSSFIAAVRVAAERALSAVDHITPLQEDTGNAKPLLKAAWIGCSGVDREQDVLDLTPIFSNLFSIAPGPNLIIDNDTNLLASPLYRLPDVSTAIVLVAGTGCIVTGFREGPDRTLTRLSRAGGWGWILGDEGSGYYIGREALRRILDASDQESTDTSSKSSSSSRPSTLHPTLAYSNPPTLQDRIFDHFGISSAPDIFTVVYAPDPLRIGGMSRPYSFANGNHTGNPSAPTYLSQERKARIAGLSPVVFRSAFTDRDSTAVDVLYTAAQHCARFIARTLPQIAEGGPSADDCVLCFGGSIAGVPEYRQLVIEILAQKGHVFQHVEYIQDPAESGALCLVELCESRDSEDGRDAS